MFVHLLKDRGVGLQYPINHFFFKIEFESIKVQEFKYVSVYPNKKQQHKIC